MSITRAVGMELTHSSSTCSLEPNVQPRAECPARSQRSFRPVPSQAMPICSLLGTRVWGQGVTEAQRSGIRMFC